MKEQRLSLHFKRDIARNREREVQQWLDYTPSGTLDNARVVKWRMENNIPTWAKGVRVDPLGYGLLYAVVVTERRGH